jgi:F0F1-type ATP synthase assembly protein I
LTCPGARVKSASAFGGGMDKRMTQAMTSYSYVGIFFGVAIVLGYAAGRWADRRFHTDPYLTIGGILIGVASSFRELYRVSKQAIREGRK